MFKMAIAHLHSREEEEEKEMGEVLPFGAFQELPDSFHSQFLFTGLNMTPPPCEVADQGLLRKEMEHLTSNNKISF